jgi:hypothetical protein
MVTILNSWRGRIGKGNKFYVLASEEFGTYRLEYVIGLPIGEMEYKRRSLGWRGGYHETFYFLALWHILLYLIINMILILFIFYLQLSSKNALFKVLFPFPYSHFLYFYLENTAFWVNRKFSMPLWKTTILMYFLPTWKLPLPLSSSFSIRTTDNEKGKEAKFLRLNIYSHEVV